MDTRIGITAGLAGVIFSSLSGCASLPAGETTVACADPQAARAVTPPPEPACANDRLTTYDGLLVLAPHPDDEVLGFAGLIDAYLEQGKPVEVVVTTDGDAYCGACQFWKNSSATGPTCGAEDLSHLATPEIDSFAEVRRAESRAALEVLGAGSPTFLGYPDTGLAAAWANFQSDHPEKALRRSDFSACDACKTCAGGYGVGPATELTATSLMRSLSERISGASENTLVATTHWLDGHGDHAALGRFVRRLNGELDTPRPVAYGVIHAHTPKDAAFADCWYPAPTAIACPCAEASCATADPAWIAELRAHRLRPDWPQTLPDDEDYGEETQLCLPEAMYQGENATKLAAIRSYASQLGFAAREGSVPEHLGGIIDCNGYLISFVRRTEAFVLVESPPQPGVPASGRGSDQSSPRTGTAGSCSKTPWE